MTDASPQPQTRLQQLIDKATNTPDALTEDDLLLDRQAGLYNELMAASTASGAFEILTATSAYLKEEGLDPKTNLLPSTLAATIQTAKLYMGSMNLPEEKSLEVITKVGRVYGVNPALFAGANVKTLADIMERDLELPSLEADIKRFGFDVKDGVIGTWNGAPIPPGPPHLPLPVLAN